MTQLAENTYFAGRYKLVKKLGSGGFSVVWLAEDTMAGNTEIALKIYAPDKGLDKDGIDNFRKEYAITLNLNHSSLLSAKHFDVSDGSPYLIMQYLSNGSALKLIENIDEKTLGRFIFQVSSGLEYLHTHEPPIVHQDIKPDNVLISSKSDFLLTDFGISTRVRRTLTKSAGNVGYSGTIAYVPPERYMRNPKPQPVGDIFAFGVMVFEMISGFLPWNEQGGLGFIGSQMIPPIDNNNFSDAVKNLAISCMSFAPEDRPTAGQIKIYAQAYVQNGFWDDKYCPEVVKKVALNAEAETKRSADEEIKRQAEETERIKQKEEEDRIRREQQAKEKAEKDAERQKQEAEKEAALKKQKEEKAKAETAKQKEDKRLKEIEDISAKADKELSAGNASNAISFYKKSIKLDPKNANLQKKLSAAESQLKKQQDERRKTDEANFIKSLSAKAVVAYERGDHKDAYKHYKALLSKDNSNDIARQRLAELDQILKSQSAKKQKQLISVLIPLIIILIAGAGAAWYFMQPKQPKALFSYDKTSLDVGDIVSYSSSSANADNLHWEFEGGTPSTSNKNNPKVRYDKAGNFSVKLIAKNDDGSDEILKSDLIEVKTIVASSLPEKEKKPEKPKQKIPELFADFTANRNSIERGKSIKFNSKARNAEKLRWEFEGGNPSFSTDNKPVVKYDKTGKFSVTLYAVNSTGEKKKLKKNFVTVVDGLKKPIARMEADVTKIYEEEFVTFSDLSQFASEREWTFEGGDPAFSTELNPEISYNTAGTYSVKLKVVNRKGGDEIYNEKFITVIESPEKLANREFENLVGEADNYYKKGDYSNALLKYVAASKIISDNKRVNRRIVDLRELLADNEKYNKTIAQADKLYNSKQYENARDKYTEALEIKPSELYPSEMLKRIGKFLNVNNVAYKIKKSQLVEGKQILVTSTGNTAIVKSSVGEVYLDNKIPVILNVEWKDSKGRTIESPKDKIVILKNGTTTHNYNVEVENFKNSKAITFDKSARLKLFLSKYSNVTTTELSIKLYEYAGGTNSNPSVKSFVNKNPSGNLVIKISTEKYYKNY